MLALDNVPYFRCEHSSVLNGLQRNYCARRICVNRIARRANAMNVFLRDLMLMR